MFIRILRVRTGPENRTPPESEITVIDAARAVVVDRIPLHAIAGVFHLWLFADGRLGVVAEYHPKNLIPLAHLEHGGAFAYTLTLFGADVGKPVEVPLDELERYASQPFGVAIAPDKSRIYVTSGGSEMRDGDRCAAPAALHSRAPGPSPDFAQDLSASAIMLSRAFPWATIRAGCAEPRRPQAVCRQPARRHDQRHRHAHQSRGATIAGRAKDGLRAAPRRADILYGALFVSRARSAAPTATSIPPSTASPGTWSRMALAADIVDNKLLEGIKDTEPYKWTGNPNIPTECGPRTEKYFWRSENYDDLTLPIWPFTFAA
jgi:hypothetical protein